MQGAPSKRSMVFAPDVRSISLLVRFEGRSVEIYLKKIFFQNFPKKLKNKFRKKLHQSKMLYCGKTNSIWKGITTWQIDGILPIWGDSKKKLDTNFDQIFCD